jgi:hypothetical protein
MGINEEKNDEIKKISVNAIPDDSIVSHRKYSNFVQVQNTFNDITMRFCEVLPMYNVPESVKDGIVNQNIPIVAEIVIPVNVVPVLIKSLQQKYDEYQNTYQKEQLI